MPKGVCALHNLLVIYDMTPSYMTHVYTTHYYVTNSFIYSAMPKSVGALHTVLIVCDKTHVYMTHFLHNSLICVMIHPCRVLCQRDFAICILYQSHVT